jgi:hypothetical protein
MMTMKLLIGKVVSAIGLPDRQKTAVQSFKWKNGIIFLQCDVNSKKRQCQFGADENNHEIEPVSLTEHQQQIRKLQIK